MKKEKNKIESLMLKKGGAGEHFYSDKSRNFLTALAVYYNKKIKTERVIAVSWLKQQPIALNICKVTIL